MHVKNMLTVNTIWIALISLTSIFIPSFLLEMNGVEVTESTLNLQRLVGAVAAGYGIVSWLMRKSPASEARQAYLFGGGVGYFIIAAVFLFNQLSTETASGNGWVFIVISVLLGIDFIFFGVKPEGIY